MKFKLFGTKIYISFFFCAVFTIMLACDRTGLVLPMLFAVIMHEIGHLFAMWIFDCAPKQIRLIPASVQIVSEFSKQYKNDIFVAVFGPAVNFVLFLTFYINYLAFKNEAVLYYALLNLLIGGFNSLPVLGLDGGTVLFSVIAGKRGVDTARVILKLITAITALSLIIVAVILTVKGKINISFYIAALYLFAVSIIK